MLYRPLPPQCAHWGTFPKGEGFVPLNSPLSDGGLRLYVVEPAFFNNLLLIIEKYMV